MRKLISSTLAVFLLAGGLAFAQEESQEPTGPRPMTVDDALDMVNVGGALMSPDGEWVLFSKSELDWAENERKTTYHMVSSSEGGESFEYIGEEGGSSFQFSPDGRYLALKRSVDGKQQIFWMRTAGGEATQLTDHETSVGGSYKWSDDSTKIFFSATDKRPEDESTMVDEDEDVVFVDEGPNGQNRSYWSSASGSSTSPRVRRLGSPRRSSSSAASTLPPTPPTSPSRRATRIAATTPTRTRSTSWSSPPARRSG